MASPYMPEAPCLQEQDLAGKVAVITGASKGIGRAIALNLATRGCAILGTYSSPTSAHQFKTLSHTISALYTNTFPSSSFSGSPSPSSPRISHHTHAPTVPKLIGITANILSSDCALMIAVILEKEFNSRCDIFINNASVAVRRRVGEIGDGDVSDSLMGNVTTPMRIMETLVRKMLLRQDARVVIVTREMVHGKGVGGLPPHSNVFRPPLPLKVLVPRAPPPHPRHNRQRRLCWPDRHSRIPRPTCFTLLQNSTWPAR